ncbi:glycosyltransferase family 9 protein [Candidatus Woesearchaeota archaeon]|nr:glycosyltransferase family 9 protein [Candidatus Woesearchaeota archaeon]
MKRILILNLVPNTIGDSILLLSFFNILRKNYGTAFIAVTADGMSKELWKDNNEINEIIEVGELTKIGDPEINKFSKAITYLKMFSKIIVRIKKRNFDTCFIIYPNFFFMHLIPVLAGIRRRIGYTYSGSLFSFLLTKKTPSKLSYDGYYDRHIIESYLDLLRVAEIPFAKKDTVCIKKVSKKDINKVRKQLSLLGISPKIETAICVHSQSKAVWRNWPPDHFKQLIIKLRKEFDALIFLLGSKEEYEYNKQLACIDKKVINLCGKLSLSEVGAILKLSDLFIGNDSGLAHFSSSVGTKTLVIFGASSPLQAGPRGYGKTITIFKNTQENTLNYLRNKNFEADLKIMRDISPREVFKKAVELLKEE